MFHYGGVEFTVIPNLLIVYKAFHSNLSVLGQYNVRKVSYNLPKKWYNKWKKKHTQWENCSYYVAACS